MITSLQRIVVAMCLVAGLAACEQRSCKVTKPIENAIYYWRTTFTLNAHETAFLQHHKVSRIYLRMFDVAVEHNVETDVDEIVPIATTRFNSNIPDHIEIVPTVYITLNALRTMRGDEAKYAELIVERLRAMASYNECGKIHEMQFDCDWTASTRMIYTALCQSARERLYRDKIALSATIRLHQLSENAPPVDRGVLMLYNTGALKNPDTRNSIINVSDVRPYLSKRKCDIPLDYAYPTFGWGVEFRDGKFQRIVNVSGAETLDDGDTVRIERSEIDEVLAVKTLVDKKLGAPSRYRIIYHLDNEQLKNYTTDEIAEIYANH